MQTLLRASSWVRLLLVALIFAAAIVAPTTVMPDAQRDVLFFVLLATVGSTAALILGSSLPLAPGKAWLVSFGDVLLITAVVAVTGGSRTLFNALYVLSIITACLLLSRTAGLAIAATASVLYAGLVFGPGLLRGAHVGRSAEEAVVLDLMTIFLNVATFLVVALVAGGLADRFRATERQLQTQREDIGNLEAVRDLIFDSVGNGLVTLSRDGRITAFNRAAQSMTGVAAAEAVGKPWAAIFGAEVPVDRIEAALGDNPSASVTDEIEVRRPDGTVTPLRVTFSALRSADGTRLGLIGACEDLEKIRQMEAQARRADRLATLGRMAANIAHEIRNPLASLTGSIEALMRKTIPEDAQARLTDIVLRESERLNDILKDFLTYARPAPLNVKPGNVAQALDDVVLLLENQTLPAGLKIVREYASHIAWDFDQQQLRQAFWNLCLNAVEAMPNGGELRLTASASHHQLAVRIADTGDGIDPDDLPHVFEPFFSTKSGETGLGLALTDRIVKDHGGEIRVTSVAGVGTTFSIDLPRHHG